jgi:hypothetical protein
MDGIEGRRDFDHRAVAWPGEAAISSLPAHSLLPIVPCERLVEASADYCIPWRRSAVGGGCAQIAGRARSQQRLSEVRGLLLLEKGVATHQCCSSVNPHVPKFGSAELGVVRDPPASCVWLKHRLVELDGGFLDNPSRVAQGCGEPGWGSDVDRTIRRVEDWDGCGRFGCRPGGRRPVGIRGPTDWAGDCGATLPSWNESAHLVLLRAGRRADTETIALRPRQRWALAGIQLASGPPPRGKAGLPR